MTGGYRRPRVKVTFGEGKGDMEGFWFRFRRPSIADLVSLSGVDDLESGTFTDRDMEIVDSVYETLAGRIVEWNLETEDGAPVPVSAEAIAEQDIEFVMELVKAMVGEYDVPDPLPVPSSVGQRWAEEALIPMEILSANHTN